MVEAKNYNEQAVNASHRVLLEISHILGEYKNGIVIVGGWVPTLLFSDAPIKHIGSTDVDLALNRRNIQEIGYRSIMDLLRARGYQQGPQPFIFYRNVKIDNQEFQVEVDFLTSEYGGTGKRHRTQIIQDLHPRKARGCDLAFEMPVEIILQGALPDGGFDHLSVKVASIIPFIIMKAFALGDRLKEKDAYDIYYCLRYYPPGLDQLIDEFRPIIRNRLIQEGFHILADKFASPNHIGAKYIADFEEIVDPDERAEIQRDAYERVQYLLRGMGVNIGNE